MKFAHVQQALKHESCQKILERISALNFQSHDAKQVLQQVVANGTTLVNGSANHFLQPIKPTKQASILVPFCCVEKKLHMLLLKKTKANEKLSKNYRHGDQLSFPGGIAKSDESLQACAFRETNEEIGYLHQLALLNATLPCFDTSTGINVQPFIVQYEHEKSNIALQKTEIESYYVVPVPELLQTYQSQGKVRVAHVQMHGEMALIERIGCTYAVPLCEVPLWGMSSRVVTFLFTVLEHALQNEDLNKNV